MNRIEFGDCRETMRAWASQGIKVQMCVTSPPYYGLRDYGVSPSIWGGDPNCTHDFNEETIKTEIGRGNWAQAVNGRDEFQPGGLDKAREPIRSAARRGYCRHCGAWLGCLGLESTPEQFIANTVEVFRAVRDVLAEDGTLWLNIGDSYATTSSYNAARTSKGAFGRSADATKPSAGQPAGYKAKDLLGIPWMLAFALRADGWYLRQDIVWNKPNPMPESVADRCTKSHEYVFLLSKSPRYFCDMEAIKEPVAASTVARLSQDIANQRGSDRVPGKTNGPMKAVRSTRNSFRRENSKRAVAFPGQSMGTHRTDRAESEYVLDTRNRRSVWTVATKPYKGAHFATFPPALIEPCILAGTSEAGHCPQCGTRAVRVVERSPMVIRKTDRNGERGTRTGTSGTMESPATSRTVAWNLGCECGGGLVPDTVLDPFMGSGTTAAVAIQHGRQYAGCELNAEYGDLQDKRILETRTALEKMATPPAVRRQPARRAARLAPASPQMPLFDQAAA